MSEDFERVSPKQQILTLKVEIQELKSVVKALLEGMKAAEEETGELFMKKGVYLGIDFND